MHMSEQMSSTISPPGPGVLAFASINSCGVKALFGPEVVFREASAEVRTHHHNENACATTKSDMERGCLRCPARGGGEPSHLGGIVAAKKAKIFPQKPQNAPMIDGVDHSDESGIAELASHQSSSGTVVGRNCEREDLSVEIYLITPLSSEFLGFNPKAISIWKRAPGPRSVLKIFWNATECEKRASRVN
ncbi:hypothetical protein FQN54_006662 [Arachnomyces sp. PD_36]|nr:hypothetical protein FQN54_006662 [Arachnomyces sp. PD_36]